MPASIRQDGYNTIYTILYFYKGEIIHHQNYAINYTMPEVLHPGAYDAS